MYSCSLKRNVNGPEPAYLEKKTSRDFQAYIFKRTRALMHLKRTNCVHYGVLRDLKTKVQSHLIHNKDALTRL